MAVNDVKMRKKGKGEQRYDEDEGRNVYEEVFQLEIKERKM